MVVIIVNYYGSSFYSYYFSVAEDVTDVVTIVLEPTVMQDLILDVVANQVT